MVGWNSLEVLAFKTGNPDRPVNAIPHSAIAYCQLRFVVGTNPHDNFNLNLTLREGSHHSGNWGGLLANPGIIMAHALATVTDARGQIKVPEWRRKTLTASVRAALADADVGADEGALRINEGPVENADDRTGAKWRRASARARRSFTTELRSASPKRPRVDFNRPLVVLPGDLRTGAAVAQQLCGAERPPAIEPSRGRARAAAGPRRDAAVLPRFNAE